MHDFKFIKDRLFCEGVPVMKIAKEFKTPLYIYSYKTIIEHFHKLYSAFSDFKPLICYSLKANSNLSIARVLLKQGAGLDIVSGGELYKALKIGASPRRIVYASVGKTEEEITRAIQVGILFFNVESDSELRVINRIAGQLGKIVQVAIRINPDIEPQTHEYITTGKLTNKFGVSLDLARRIFINRGSFPNIKFNAVHMHIGSQIISSRPFIGAIRRVLDFVLELLSLGIKIEYLNIGGGLGIIYKNEKPQTAHQFSKNISGLLRRANLKIILEPGRFIVGNAGILVTKVIYVKKNHKKIFVIVDAGMNDLMRPALYGAYHDILPLARRNNRGKVSVDVVGPICESADFLAKNRKMQKVSEGELLAVMSTGAYGFSMASNYNSRLQPAEVLVKGKNSYLIRERQNFKDLIKGEHIVKFLK
ncbi:MAG: diaminopimelate decarboxylase [Candidatus Omnitrophota bacterium]